MLSMQRNDDLIEQTHAAIARAEHEQIEAIALVAQMLERRSTERARGLTTETELMLQSRLTGHDARVLTQLASTYRAMPHLADALRRGSISLSQFKEIAYEVRTVDGERRDAIDDLIARTGDTLANADPDHLVWVIRDKVAELRPDLALAREDRAMEANRWQMQMRLDGSSDGSFHFDPETTAVVAGTLDAAASRPVDTDDPGAPSRSQQHGEAVRVVFEHYASGGIALTRPRARMLVTCDVATLSDGGLSEAARILTSLVGKAPRMTKLSTEILLCDSEFVPVIFEAGRPIAVGDAHAPISSKLRTALVARDLGCRFPGCGAPASWTDAHHLVHRLHGGETSIDNLALFCRRHHRSIHRHRWKVRMERDGTIEFRHRGRRYISPPPTRRE